MTFKVDVLKSKTESLGMDSDDMAINGFVLTANRKMVLELTLSFPAKNEKKSNTQILFFSE